MIRACQYLNAQNPRKRGVLCNEISSPANPRQGRISIILAKHLAASVTSPSATTSTRHAERHGNERSGHNNHVHSADAGHNDNGNSATAIMSTTSVIVVAIVSPSPSALSLACRNRPPVLPPSPCSFRLLPALPNFHFQSRVICVAPNQVRYARREARIWAKEPERRSASERVVRDSISAALTAPQLMAWRK
jgi:hypothetical protein